MPRFTTEVLVPRPREEVFAFFADAGNLEVLTPPWLRFEILTPRPIEMRPGALIDYRLRLHGIPLRWRTEIVVWEPPERFVDLMVRGPYRHWRHTHTFEEAPGGTRMADDVEYRVPGGFLADRLFVRRDVRRIFAFRRERLLAAFA